MSCDFCEVFYWVSIPVAWLALGMTIADALRKRRERREEPKP